MCVYIDTNAGANSQSRQAICQSYVASIAVYCLRVRASTQLVTKYHGLYTFQCAKIMQMHDGA